MDDVDDHLVCAHGDTWFSRTLCSEPCGNMHTYCTECGACLDHCANENVDLSRYHMTPIPKPPFVDQAAADAALGASLIHVTRTVTGMWPSPPAVMRAIDALTHRE
jgi:hypothetical protein